MVQTLPIDTPPREHSQTTSKQKTRRMLNVPLVVGTLIAAAVFGPAAYFWHSYQVYHTAGTFLERAEVLRGEKNWRAAAEYLHRYLRLYPADESTRIALAETYDESADDPREKLRSVDFYYRAVGVASSSQEAQIAARKPDLRRRLAELLLEVGRLASAEAEAKRLDDNNPQGWRLLALALFGQSQSGALATERPKTGGSNGDVQRSEWQEGTIGKASEGKTVEEAFQRALELNRGDVELSATLARIYRDETTLLSDQNRALSDAERAALADTVVEQMVTHNPGNADAFVARYLYRIRYELPQAKNDLEAALKLGPNNPAFLLLAAEHARREAERAKREEESLDEVGKHYDEARKYYEHAIEVAPSNEGAYWGLGNIYLAQRETDRAIEVWRRGLEESNKNSIRLNSRLAEVLLARGQLEQAKNTLDVLDRALEKLGPRLTRPARLSLVRAIALLRANWLVRTGSYVEAVPLLKQVAAGQQTSPSEVRQRLRAQWLLGGAYAALNKWDQAAAAYEQAATLRPKMAQARLAAAAAWIRAVEPERAILDYQQALTLDDTAETRFALALARFNHQKRLPKKARNWDLFSKALDEAKSSNEPLADAWQLALLETDYELVRAGERGAREEGVRTATELLRGAEAKYPDSPSLLARLILRYEGLDHPEDADRAMTELDNLASDSVTTYLVRSRLYSGRKQYAQAREVLRQGLQILPAKAHTALKDAIVRVDLEEGHAGIGRDQLLKFHKENPSNAAVVRRLAEFALKARDFEDAEHWEEKLLKLEGPNGVYWRYFRVRRLLTQAKDSEAPEFTEATRLLAEIQSQRPAWSEVYLLNGFVQQKQGSFQQAIESYQEAIRSGTKAISAYERLIMLLCRAQRFDEAAENLSKAQDQDLASGRLRSLEIAVAAGQGRLDRAVELARRDVEERPEDPIAQVRYGQVLLAAKLTEQAEAALQRAVELASDDIRTHNALFAFYIRNKQLDRAQEVLEQLPHNVKMSDTQRALALAAGYEAIGDRKKAEASYRQAAQLAPDNVAIQIQLAKFVRQNDPGEAEEILRRLAPGSSHAQQVLAVILADSGVEEDWEEALKLLEPMGVENSESDLSQRLKAKLMVLRGGEENRKQARRIFEELVWHSNPPLDGDRISLAYLYEAEGKLQAARQQYVALVARADPNPSHLVFYVDLLLRHNLQDEATAWLGKLEELAPDDLATAELRARWLKARNSTSQIEPLVEPLAARLLEDCKDDEQQTAQMYLRVGNLYSAVERHQAAQRWYRRLKELVPERYQPLAMSLARQDRMSDAIELCIEAAKSDTSAQPAITLAMILLAGQPTTEDSQRAEPLLLKAVENHKDSVTLLNSLANVRIVQQRVEDAEKLYRRVLSLEPKHLLALNNLATLLSEQPGKTQEALKWIDQAIVIAKQRNIENQAVLLDTKGMVLVHQGEPDDALPLLLAAASAPKPDPRYHFHLAVAYYRVGERDKARKALESAHAGKLEHQVLTQADRKLLAELEQKLPH